MMPSCIAKSLRILRAITLVILSTIAVPPLAIAATTDVTQTQEASIRLVLHDFYKSYIALLSEDKIPSREFLAKTVSTKLIRKIQKLASVEGGLDADYFLKAQDYLDEWKENITVAPIRVAGNRAKAVVSLELARGRKHQLSVDLVLVGRHWKITEVRDVPYAH